jgi:YD repeat-containing protein
MAFAAADAAGLMDPPPPTAEECLCGGTDAWIGAPDDASCFREFKFPPEGGYTDSLDDELNLPPGISEWRPFVSTCWATYQLGAAVPFSGDDDGPNGGLECGSEQCMPNWSLRGFAPSISLRFGVAQGEFGPVSLDPALGTLPLAPASGSYGSPRSPITRPTIGDTVDLITGQPLVREVDFELPYGNTVFRHIRTYSQVPELKMEDHSALSGSADYRLAESGLFWDATGYGWMIGHSPLLLIDAAYAGWDLGVPYDNGEQRSVERCMFLPDAHRSIPFHSLKDEGRYEAAPRFDAVLGHNGDPDDFVTDGSGHHWEVKPTEWSVWLQGRSIQYTMMPVYDDLQWNGSNANSINQYPAPIDVCAYDEYRYGTPHYAVATKIEDEWGNRIEIDYCSFKQRHSDSVANGSSGCATCCQECSSKGTIEQVRLIAGREVEGATESDRVAYRLVYVYRPSGVLNTHGGEQEYVERMQPMVHEVYVVPGDVNVPAGCRTVARQPFVDAMEVSSDTLEILNAYHAVTWDETAEIAHSGDASWMDEWIIRVKYLYAEDAEPFTSYISQNAQTTSGIQPGCQLRLLQASVTTRTEGDPYDEVAEMVESTSHTIYRYRWNYDGSQREIGQLRAIYRNDTLNRMRTGAGVPQSGLVQESWPLHVHVMLDEDPPGGGGTSGEHVPDLIEWADQSYDYWNEDRVGKASLVDNLIGEGTYPDAAPFHLSQFHREMVEEYLDGVPNDPPGGASTSREEQPVLCLDGAATHVTRVGGQSRPFRLYRFLMASSKDGEVTLPPCAYDEPPTPTTCEEIARYPVFSNDPTIHRAQIHEPYLQRIGETHEDTVKRDTSLANPLWVSVVDEYDSVATLLETAVSPDGGEWRSIAELREDEDEHLLPLTRRVVLMNPAGVVLSDRTYDIRKGGVADSTGMWEEFVYDWQDDETFKLREIPNDPDTRPLAIGRLLEHRTFGWSISASGGGTTGPETEGVVNVFEYDLRSVASEEMRKTLLPSRIGVKWGTTGAGPGGPYLTWLKEFVRDPKRPELVLHEIDYLTPDAGTTPILQPLTLTELAERALDGDVRITTRAYLEDVWRGGAPEDEPTDFQPPVFAEMTIQPPSIDSPTGALLWPISITYTDMHWRDEEGQDPTDSRPGDKDVWTGVGKATTAALTGGRLYTVNGEGAEARHAISFNPADEADLPEFYASVERSLNNGQVIFKVVDVNLGNVATTGDDAGELGVATEAHSKVLATSITSESQEFGASLSRAQLGVPFSDLDGQSPWFRNSDAERPPLEHWSYVGPYTTMPRYSINHTGRQMRSFQKNLPPVNGGDPWVLQVYMCDGLYPTGVGNILQAYAPSTVTDSIDGVSTITRTAIWGSDTTFGNIPDLDDAYIPNWIEYAMDSLGRPNGYTVSDLTDAGGQSLEQKVTYGRFGEISREKHHDGTIVRNVADERGRLIRVYKGSQDNGTYWGGSGGDDDMILVEKRTYGEGVRDANLPTVVRNYRLKPGAQYAAPDDDEELDDEGWSTETIYDWRGGPLVARHRDDNGDVTHQQVTFRDHADNVMLTATYGSTLPWNDDSIPTLDPVATTLDLPLVSELLAGEGLIALESRTYNLRGQVEVVTTYNVEAASVNSFTTSRTYYDFAGRVVWSQGEGGIVTTNIQDAKGRQIVTTTKHGDIELTRTETAYTDQDQPFRVKTYDRRHDASESETVLDDDNAIVTLRFTWYDHAGRVRATADIGTGDASAMVNHDIEQGATPFVWSPIDQVGWVSNAVPGEVIFLSACARPEGLPVTARISSFAYDESGNQIVSVDPMGVVTRSRYNGFGQLVLQWENANRDLTQPPEADSRLTATTYSGAEVARIGVLVDSTAIVPAWLDPKLDLETDPFDINEDLPWDDGMLVSRVGTGATVLNAEPDADDGDPITSGGTSFSGSLTSWLDYPTTGTLGDPSSPSTPHDITYTYYADGLLATRTDERGVIFKYYYDHAGRLTKLLADESDCSTYQHNVTPPKDRIDKIEFVYDAAKGHLNTAVAYDRGAGTGGADLIVSSTDFAYDSRGNLYTESQYHAGAQIPTFDPTVWYNRTYAPDGASGIDNYDRLTSIQYPVPVPDGMSTTNRVIEFSYGEPGSITDAAGRIAEVTSSGPAAHFLASFRYTGSGRRVAFDRGGVGGSTPSPAVRSSVFDNPIAAWDQGSTPDEDAYYGLSPFGEVRALAYWREVSGGGGTTTEVLAAQRYAYDAAGRRTAVWHQHVPIANPNAPPTSVGTNERSQLFGYDPLGRLIDAEMGQLVGPLTDTQSGAPGITFSNLLGTAREVTWGLDTRDVWTSRVQTDESGTETLAHHVGDRNELLGYEEPPAGSPPSDPTDRFHNDASGNLIFDGDRFYEYDAWGRLVKVSERGSIQVDPLSVGSTEYELSGTPGPWLVHYTYDGLGRLIRKQTPVRGELLGNQTHVRSERYYYDGARRIQEVVATFTPATSGGSGGGSGGSGGTLGSFEALDISDEIGSVTGEWNPGLLVNDLRVDREYVYVPSAAGGYVDEFIGQFDRYGDPWWILQDANYNVLAMTDADGDVARQVMYDPYGEPLFAEDFGAHPGLKIGHQGLFFDRLEPPAAVSGSISIGGATQLEPGVFGLYQARNRVLLSRYGRWAQKDPNASGQSLVGIGHGGSAPVPNIALGALTGVMVDGSNLFAAVGNSPFNSMDPHGLFGFASALMTGVDMFDMMTDAMDQARTGLREGFQFATGVLDYNDALFDAIDWALDPDAAWDEYAAGPSGLSGAGTASAGSGLTLATRRGPNSNDPGWEGWSPRARNGRSHGGPAHNEAMHKIANAAGEGKVKFNQALKRTDEGAKTIVNADGRSFRPDLQIRTSDNTLVLVEICHSQSKRSANTKLMEMKQLLSDHGIVNVRTVSLFPNEVDGWIRRGMTD